MEAGGELMTCELQNSHLFAVKNNLFVTVGTMSSPTAVTQQ